MHQPPPPEPGRPPRTDRSGSDGPQPDRYARLLRVLIAERLRASAQARDTTSKLARGVIQGAAASLRIRTRQIIVAETNRTHPAASKAALHGYAMDLMRDLEDQVRRALTSPDAPPAEPTTTEPQGNAAAADRLVAAIAAAYITAEGHTTHAELNPAQLRAVAGQADQLYRTLLELAVEHLRLEMPEETRPAVLLLNAFPQRNAWVSQARRAARNKTAPTAQRPDRTEGER
ncbi:hypothetical protein [Actinomadura violacea]|uniref:Uncharacterized protein n=1 Tax=Actinomadura violacea TaxID=2819934 RepID=A0ABS3S7K8_9ACTN|nr:hypothetical protein [Actinomadura violacea]MBO2464989.1 hypothetical protein [Actinomadura violacea]